MARTKPTPDKKKESSDVKKQRKQRKWHPVSKFIDFEAKLSNLRLFLGH